VIVRAVPNVTSATISTASLFAGTQVSTGVVRAVTNVTSATVSTATLFATDVIGSTRVSTATVSSAFAYIATLVSTAAVSSASVYAVTQISTALALVGTNVSSATLSTATAYATDVIGASRVSTAAVSTGTIGFGQDVLSYYQISTFTPGLTFGGTSTGMTFTQQEGAYVRIGHFVQAALRIRLSAKGSSVGAAVVNNLPFAAANIGVAFHPACAVYCAAMSTTVATQFQALVLNNTSTIFLSRMAAGAGTGLADTDFTDTSDIIINCMYRA
jgi:hypothetical protein